MLPSAYNESELKQTNFYFSLLEKDTRATALLKKFQTKNQYPLEVNREAINELYMRKLRAKESLEILSFSEIANTRCKQLLTELNELEQKDSAFQKGFINDTLNFFERCYGIHFEETRAIRALLEEPEPKRLQAISETRSLWEKYHPLFSARTTSDLIATSAGSLHASGISLPATILMARAVDHLKSALSEEAAWNILSSLPYPEAGQRMFAYIFQSPETHFEHLFEEYNEICAQKETQRQRPRQTPRAYIPLIDPAVMACHLERVQSWVVDNTEVATPDWETASTTGSTHSTTPSSSTGRRLSRDLNNLLLSETSSSHASGMDTGEETDDTASISAASTTTVLCQGNEEDTDSDQDSDVTLKDAQAPWATQVKEMSPATSCTAQTPSWADVVKKPLPVLSVQKKEILSLYAQALSLDISSSTPPAQFLLTRNGRRIPLRQVEARESAATTAQPSYSSKLSRTQSVANLAPSVRGKQPSNTQPYPSTSRLKRASSLASVAAGPDVVPKPSTERGSHSTLAERIRDFLKGKTPNKGASSEKKKPGGLTNRFKHLLGIQEDESEMQVVLAESEPSDTESGMLAAQEGPGPSSSSHAEAASTKAKKPKKKKSKSKKPAVQALKKDDDVMPEKAVAAENATTATAKQPIAAEKQASAVTQEKKNIRTLLQDTEVFLSQFHSRGEQYSCRVETMVSILLRAEKLLADVENAEKEKGFKKSRAFLTAKRNISGTCDTLRTTGIPNFLREYESQINNERGTLSDYSNGWQKLPLLIKPLYDANRLQQFLPPDISIKHYCTRLLDKLDALEKKHLVQNKKCRTGNETEATLLQEICDRSVIAARLYVVQRALGPLKATEMMSLAAVVGLEDIAKRWKIPHSAAFFDQFTAGQSQEVQDFNYSLMWKDAACVNGKVDYFNAAQLLLPKIDPNKVYDSSANEPTLHLACSYNKPALVKILLGDKRTDPNLLGNNRSPLMQACAFRDVESVQLLLAHPKTDPNMHTGRINPTPILNYLFSSEWQDKEEQELQKTIDIMKLLVQNKKTNLHGLELEDAVMFSPNFRLREVFLDECRKLSFDANETRKISPLFIREQAQTDISPSLFHQWGDNAAARRRPTVVTTGAQAQEETKVRPLMRKG